MWVCKVDGEPYSIDCTGYKTVRYTVWLQILLLIEMNRLLWDYECTFARDIVNWQLFNRDIKSFRIY